MAAEVAAKKTIFEVSTAQVLFRSAVATSFSPYDVESDGQKFLVKCYGEPNLPLTLLVNWTAILKRH
jgi:hypothetical protein